MYIHSTNPEIIGLVRPFEREWRVGELSQSGEYLHNPAPHGMIVSRCVYCHLIVAVGSPEYIEMAERIHNCSEKREYKGTS